jgi:hypothetical protein
MPPAGWAWPLARVGPLRMIEVATLKTAFLRRPGRLGEGYRWVSVVRESEVPDLRRHYFDRHETASAYGARRKQAGRCG